MMQYVSDNNRIKSWKKIMFSLIIFSNDITSGFSVARITVPKTDLEWSINHRCEC